MTIKTIHSLKILDGTHIPSSDQARYRNRKGYLSQNVLAVCNFDMQFVYVLAGWEGSAHDGRVLQDAQAVSHTKREILAWGCRLRLHRVCACTISRGQIPPERAKTCR